MLSLQSLASEEMVTRARKETQCVTPIKLLFGLVVALIATTPAFAQQQLVPVTLTTGWILAGNSAPLIIADQNGYFAEGGVKVNIVRGYGSADVVTKVGAGAYQAGTGYFPVLVQAIAKDPNFDAIAVMISYDASPDSITGPKKTGIKTPKDLAGRKISAQPNAPTTLMFEFVRQGGRHRPVLNQIGRSRSGADECCCPSGTGRRRGSIFELSHRRFRKARLQA